MMQAARAIHAADPYESYRIGLAAEAHACACALASRFSWRKAVTSSDEPRMRPYASKELAKVSMQGCAAGYEAVRLTRMADKLAERLLGAARLGRRTTTVSELEMLYRTQGGQLRMYLRQSLGASAEDADDILQAVFERFAGRATGKPVGTPLAFLKTIARHQLLDQQRRKRVRHRYCADAMALEMTADTLNAERILSGREQLWQLERALGSLDARSSKVLLLSRLDGLSSAEIARREGCSPTLVKRIIARAEARCRDAFAEATSEISSATDRLQ